MKHKGFLFSVQDWMTSIDTNSPKVRQRLLLANHIADLT